MVKKYGQIFEDDTINQSIYDCFDFLTERDQKKFVKKFRDIPHTQTEVINTICELILGAYLCSNGFKVEYDRKIGIQKPDWSILDEKSNITAVVEMFYLHIDQPTANFILDQHNSGNNVIAYFPNSNDPGYRRLFSKIKEKADKYQEIIAERNVPFVIALYIDSFIVIDVQKVRDCMMSAKKPLFKLYPDLSGVFYFCESKRGSYYFELIENPYALRKIEIPTGSFIKR